MTFSGKLRSFAQALAPDQYDVRRAGEAIDEISRIVQANFKGRGLIDRITPFGSYPKKTSISGMMDIDIIVYINNHHPPFYDIIEELHNILPCRCKSQCHCDRNEYGIKFCFDGFKIDLLPAVNFLPSWPRHYYTNGQSVRVQHELALEYVKKVPKHIRHYYSTSLSCASVLFEKERDSFSHCLSRLAKYWSSKVPVDNIIGRSSITEYMAAYAADQQSGYQDIVEGFRRFLEFFESSKSLNIYWTNFYRMQDVPNDIRRKRPLLLDPCNPYNNYFDVKDNAYLLKKMHPFAEATLSRLEVAVMDFSRGREVTIEDIFYQDYHVMVASDESGVYVMEFDGGKGVIIEEIFDQDNNIKEAYGESHLAKTGKIPSLGECDSRFNNGWCNKINQNTKVVVADTPSSVFLDSLLVFAAFISRFYNVLHASASLLPSPLRFCDIAFTIV